MDTETNIKVNYVGFTRRAAAEVLDAITYLLLLSILILPIALSDDSNIYADFFDETKELPYLHYAAFTLVLLVLEILMVTKFGGTPGKLLCGMYIKNTDTFKNVTLTQATIRSISKTVFWITSSLLIDYVSRWFAVLPILVLIFAIFDQRKQTFYDKFANTVVIDYKPS